MITIRAADVGDAKVLTTLNAIVQALHVLHRPDHFKETSVAELEAWYRSLLEEPGTRAWIAEAQGWPVGYVLALIRNLPGNNFTKDRAWLEVDQLAVDPEYRRQGIGRALVMMAIAHAHEEGIGRVEATSWSFNHDTHHLFEDLGFAPKTIRFELSSGAKQ